MNDFIKVEDTSKGLKFKILGYDKKSWINYNDISFVPNPTNNCQLMSFSGIQPLLDYCARMLDKNKDETNEAHNERVYKLVARLIEDGLQHYGKYCMLFDVNAVYSKSIEKMAKYFECGEILTKSQYTSSNESAMVLYIIKVYENPEYDDDYDDEW